MNFSAHNPGRQWTQHPNPPAGHDFQYGSYGGFGAFDQPSDTSSGRSKKKPLLIGGGAVVLLGAGAMGAWVLGAFQGDVLSQSSLEGGVVEVLTDSYGEHDVSHAQCPANQPIDTGHTFGCSVEVAGQERTVEIRVLNDEPEFEVGAPE